MDGCVVDVIKMSVGDSIKCKYQSVSTISNYVHLYVQKVGIILMIVWFSLHVHFPDIKLCLINNKIKKIIYLSQKDIIVRFMDVVPT